MRGPAFIACVIVAAACSSSTTNQLHGTGGSAGQSGGGSGGSAGTSGSGGMGATGGAGGTSASGGQGGSGGQAGSAGAGGGSGGVAGAGGGDAALGGSAGVDASLGGSAGADASLGGSAGADASTGGSGGTGGGDAAVGGAGGTAGSDAGDAATGGSAGDASSDASSDAGDGATGADAGADAPSDAPPADAGACPGGVTGGDGTVHYPRWKIAGDARPDSEFTVSANVVLDHTTCLMWHRAVSSGLHTHAAAKALCEASTLDGYPDWRLPTRAELISLIDFTKFNPALNSTVFPGVPNTTNGSRFWASTLKAGDASQAWVVLHGSYGQVTYFDLTNTHSVRCVRGLGGPTVPRFDTSVAGVVKDNETSLIWEASATLVGTPTDSANHCAQLTLAGSSDWRVPTARELSTLVDPTMTSPSLPSYFSPLSSDHWTSTPAVNLTPAQNWVTWIGLGYSIPSAAPTNPRVRCVR